MTATETAINLIDKVINLQEMALRNVTQTTLTERRDSVSDDYFQSERRRLGIHCDKCGGDGFIFTIHDDGHDYMHECSCMAVYKNLKRIDKSGLSKAFERCTFDSYKTPRPWQRQVKDKALAFLAEREKWFFIGGVAGSGKTHICTAICGGLISASPVHYMPWREDIVSIKANATNIEEYQRLTNRPKYTDVLYIDDFFKGSVTNGDINAAFEILNHRYNKRFVTIISSEYDIDGIIGIDSAIGSRLYEMTKGYQISLSGNDKNIRLEGL